MLRDFVSSEISKTEDRLVGILSKKSDIAVVDVKLKGLKEDTQRIDVKAERAMDKAVAHECVREDIIYSLKDSVSEISRTLDSWKTLKIAGVLSLVIAILSAAYFIFQVQSETAMVKAEVVNLKTDVASVQDGNDRLQKSFVKLNTISDDQYNMILNNLSDIKIDLGKARTK